MNARMPFIAGKKYARRCTMIALGMGKMSIITPKATDRTLHSL